MEAAMIRFKCLVNGAIDAPTRDRVAQGVRAIYGRHFGLPPAQLQIDFIEVAAGMWFTAGRPSQASMVLGSVPHGTTQPVRVQVMDELARLFSDATGAPYHDVMVVAADARA